MSAVNNKQIRMLAPFLEGTTPTHVNVDKDTGEETREWNLKCPIHGDKRRSASLNIDKGLFYCNVCGGMPITELIRRHGEWLTDGDEINGHHPDLNGAAPNKKHRVLTEGLIGGWHSALMSNASALQWLKERRGINAQTVEKFEIGMVDGKHYTIPIRSEERDIWNVRYYNPNPGPDRRKIWSESGYGSPPRLYPIQILNSDPDEIIICAGEWDALLANQFGFNTVTRTAGENQWDNSWGPWFKDMRVYVCQDRDEEGDTGAKKIARSLDKVAEVRIVELPYPIVKKHGQDLTDFLMENKAIALRELLDAAPRFGKHKEVKPEEELEVVTVLDTFDARHVGEECKVIVTIKGKKEPGYTVPKRYNLVCSQDAGAKCSICPLNAANGAAKIDVAHDDPLILAMIDVPVDLMHKALGEAYGIPTGRCMKMTTEIEEHQAVQVLFARPALDYSDGTEAGQYANLKITSVGQHDTSSNNTVSAIGALQPSPKTQGNEFLAHDLQIMETSVDKFEMTPQNLKMMQAFQVGANQRPMAKLAEISKNLAQHVTLIRGRPEMHALMDLTFHSVLGFNFSGEPVVKGWLESIILGDTGTGKSTASARLMRHYSAGELVSCEAATYAGVVGGVQQLGNSGQWAVTWGVIPQNDKRLVALDEISGLTTEDIAQMSDVRSSGIAKLTKIASEVTHARCRLLWMGNPREATMDRFTYGVDALKPLIGNAEDIARFDMAMAVTKFDVPAEVINQPHEGGKLKYSAEACHQLLMWAWTRKADQVKWGPGAEKKVYDLANELGKMYTESPPLILASSVRIKIARISVALAARVFSTDAKHDCVVVKVEHVEDAVAFLNIIYGQTAFGYRERSREYLSDRLEAEKKKKETVQYLLGRPALAKYLRSAGTFRRQDLEETLDIPREEANGITNSLWAARMIRKERGDWRVEPTLHTLLRETKL